LKDGGEAMSALEMLDNYMEEFDQMGARVVCKDDGTANAVLRQDDGDTWMEVDADGNLNELHVTVVVKQPLKQTLLSPSGADYKLIGHMPDFVAGKPTKSRFDQFSFLVHSDDGNNRVNVQGATYAIEYDLKKGAQPVFALASHTNYRNAFKQMGADILYTDDTSTVARYDDNVKLSQDRAASVVAAIIAAGIDAGRLQASGNGPISPFRKTTIRAAARKTAGSIWSSFSQRRDSTRGAGVGAGQSPARKRIKERT
jgi:OmpA family